MTLSIKKTASQRKKAVVIAKDVIKQIKAKQYIATQGHYVSGLNIKAFKGQVELQKVLKTKAQSCQACALGSLFLSKVAKYNQCKINTKDIDPALKNNLSIQRYHANEDNITDRYNLYLDIDKHLSSAFTKEEIIMIESCFEVQDMSATSPNRYSVLDPERLAFLGKFMYKGIVYPYSKLIHICNNIIRNKGIFMPSREAFRAYTREYCECL